MVALNNLMPDNPDEKAEIRRLLESDRELRAIVQRVGAYGIALFPDATLSLNTRQHDEWDPPLSMIITAPYSDRHDFSERDRRFTSWLASQSGYDPDRLFVMVLPHNRLRRIA